MKDGSRKPNPFRKKRESETMSISDENRMAIVGMIEELEKLMTEVKELKGRIEVLENVS